MSSENGIYRLRKESLFPMCTVDVIINMEGKIILIKRRYPPLGWALPGGFVERGESLETAARREVKEETGLSLDNLEQFRAYSDPDRDPRFHTISVVFTAEGKGAAIAATDADEVALFDPGCLPGDMAFDHRKIIEDFLTAGN